MKEFLENKGIEIIESYNLVNNYGFIISYKNYKFDLRYWANCYGVALNKWCADYLSGEVKTEEQEKEVKNYEKELEEIIAEANIKGLR